MTRKKSPVVLAATLWLALAAAPSAAADCKLTQYASVDLVMPLGGGVLVPVRIGQNEALMVLQMSSGLAMLDAAAVSRFGLKSGPVRTDIKLTSGGTPIEREVKLESLVIGGADFAGWRIYVQPGPERQLPMLEGKPVIGALSSNYFNAVDMELDLARGKMNLFKHARCKGEQVYWSDEYATEYLYVDPSGLLYFPISLDGKRIEASLNTQGPRTRLSESIARRFFGFKRNPGMAPAPAPERGGRPFSGTLNMSLSSRKVELPVVPVYVFDDTQRDCEYAQSARGSNAIGFSDCFGVVPLDLGTELLRQLRFYIASEEKRIYFTHNTAPAAAPVQ